MPPFDPLILSQIRQLIAEELQAAGSEEDLLQRLAAKGYGLRLTERGQMLTTLPHGVEIAPLH